MCPKGLVCCFGGSFSPTSGVLRTGRVSRACVACVGFRYQGGCQEAALLHRVDCVCDSLSLWQGSFHLQEDDAGKGRVERFCCAFMFLFEMHSPIPL